MKIQSKIAAVAAALVITACASTTGKLLEKGATQYTQDELVALVSGKTEKWTKGAGYFAPDGRLLARWEGGDVAGSWSTTEKGEVCYQVKEWGSIPCAAYFHDGDMLTTVYKGKAKTVAISENYWEGNRLEDF